MKLNKSAMIVRLESDNRVIQTLELTDKCEPISIGRAPDNTWPVDSPSVDPHHARIVMRRSSLVLEDLGKSGIFLLEKRIKDRTVMRVGESYRIGRGNTKLSIEKIERQPQAQEQYHRLEQLTGENKGAIYQIRKKDGDDFLIIGSGEKADIRIPESWISKAHALLEVKEEGCFIYDGNLEGKPSRNGTKVAQEPVLPHQGNQAGRQLQDGQIVSLAHVDLRFWDKDAVHIRSHFFLRLAVALMTALIVIGGYFFFLSLTWSASKYREKAEEAAAQSNFKAAHDYIDKSLSARGADEDAPQRMAFLRKLELWENTSAQWNAICAALNAKENHNWQEINKLFATLMYSGAPDDENWKWNTTTALQEMGRAQKAHTLVSAKVIADDSFRSSNSDFDYLERQMQTLSGALNSAREAKLPFPALMAVAEETSAELEFLLEKYRSASEILAGYDSAEQTEDVYASINAIRTQYTEHMSERTKKDLPTSYALIQYCDSMLAPLKLMAKSEEILQKNYETIARLELDKFQEKLSLPDSRQFSVLTTLGNRCTEMQQTLDNQMKIVRELNNYLARFKEDKFTESGIPPLLQKLFDEEKMENVLSCDCLKSRMPGSQEKEATSDFDEILGVHGFYSYLESLNDETFDSSVFNSRFSPVLFQSLEYFDMLNTYLDFCYARKNKALAHDMEMIRNVSPGNRVMAFASNASGIMEKRKSLMRKLLGTALTSPDDRKGIIAGGIVCRLKDDSSSFVPDDFPAQIYKSHRKLHAQLSEKQNKIMGIGSTPEERIETEKTILSLGIPGDPILRQSWSDLLSEH